MSGDKQNYKRKNYFIKKEFQTRFILKFCLLLLLGVVISTGLLYLFSQDTLTSSFENSRLQIRSTGFAILPSVILTNLITLAFITVATVLVTVFVSHRIAGPLFRFEKELREIGHGDLTKKVVLRKKDQFSAMAASMNSMVSELHEKLAVVQKDVDQIREDASLNKDAEDLVQALDRLHEKIGTTFKL